MGIPLYYLVVLVKLRLNGPRKYSNMLSAGTGMQAGQFAAIYTPRL